jgi:Fe2+ transport protein
MLTARPVILLAGILMSGSALAQTAQPQLIEPKVQSLGSAADPLKKAVLVGRIMTGNMVFQLELEGSEAMWMQMGTPVRWGAHTPAADERYHVELKLTDPKTRTRIPYAGITFAATNTDTGKSLSIPLPPMWGSSGLHYSENSALLGDGTYSVKVTVDTPVFQRELKDKDLWSKPVSAKFHFRLKDGKLTEVSKPEA